MSDVRELGRSKASGDDALAMLALKVAFAAADGVISGDKDQDGQDDYARAYTEYTKARDKKAIHEHTAGGLKAQISKLRQIGTAATMTTCDFYASINKALDKRAELKGEKQKVRPAYHMVVDLARTQIEQPDDVTDEQIEESCRKPEAGEKTLEGEIKRMEKIASDLIAGEKGVSCQEQWLLDVQAVLASQLSAFQVKRETAETLAKCQALGITIAPATTELTELPAEVIELCTDSAADGYVA
jgi:hypothetical protein